MKNYKYFENAEKNAYFTEVPCQFCGSDKFCLDAVFFERDDIESICLDCFDKKENNVEIPDYIRIKVKKDSEHKFEMLKFTPPVPWIQINEWPACCDDYLVYIGEWGQEEFNNSSQDKDGKSFLKRHMDDEQIARVESFDVLWNELGNETVAFVFRCSHCKRKVVICQDY